MPRQIRKLLPLQPHNVKICDYFLTQPPFLHLHPNIFLNNKVGEVDFYLTALSMARAN